jgi:hypothetical protein
MDNHTSVNELPVNAQPSLRIPVPILALITLIEMSASSMELGMHFNGIEMVIWLCDKTHPTGKPT